MQIHDDGKRLGRPPVAPAPGSFAESFQHANQSGDTQTLLDHSVYAVDNGDTAIPLLYLTDRHSGTRFLVDSGVTVSIFPASLQDQKTRPQTTPSSSKYPFLSVFVRNYNDQSGYTEFTLKLRFLD